MSINPDRPDHLQRLAARLPRPLRSANGPAPAGSA